MVSMGALDVILALAKVFIMILPGYIIMKLGIIDTTHTKGVSNIITYVTYPCLVIAAMQGNRQIPLPAMLRQFLDYRDRTAVFREPRDEGGAEGVPGGASLERRVLHARKFENRLYREIEHLLG